MEVRIRKMFYFTR